MPDPISVNAGFGWTAAGAWGAFLTLIGVLIKQIAPWKKLTTDADESLRKDMMARVDSLEKQVDVLRAELIAHHDRCDKIIAEIRAQHALEMHDLRNQHLLELANALGRKMNEERPTQ